MITYILNLMFLVSTMQVFLHVFLSLTSFNNFNKTNNEKPSVLLKLLKDVKLIIKCKLLFENIM